LSLQHLDSFIIDAVNGYRFYVGIHSHAHAGYNNPCLGYYYYLCGGKVKLAPCYFSLLPKRILEFAPIAFSRCPSSGNDFPPCVVGLRFGEKLRELLGRVVVLLKKRESTHWVSVHCSIIPFAYQLETHCHYYDETGK